MDHFTYRNGNMYVEGRSIESVVADPKVRTTPFYCYSRMALEQNARAYTDAVRPGSAVFFAVKANSNLGVLNVLGKAGLGADVVSVGEIKRAIKAEIDPKKIVYSGGGKTEADITYALEQGILQFNVESEPELKRLSRIAHKMDKFPEVALRINPNIRAGGAEGISTGKERDKFGIPIESTEDKYAMAETLPNIMIKGISMHIGSQETDLKKFRKAYELLHDEVVKLEKRGIKIDRIDLGGGLGVHYDKSKPPPPSPREYAAMVDEIFGDMKDKQLMFEPGRSIVADAGVLVTKVVEVKYGKYNHVYVDVGMNDFMRLAMPYNATHAIEQARQPADDGNGFTADVVGQLCESCDTFGQDVVLPDVKEGDLLVLRDAGAYGSSMSNNYNSRPLIGEVMVDGEEVHVVREPQDDKQMMENDRIPELRERKWTRPGNPAGSEVSGRPERR